MSATKSGTIHVRRFVVATASAALLVGGLAPMSSAAALTSPSTTVLTLGSKTIAGVPASVAPGYHTFILKESAAQLKKDPRGLDVLQLAKGYSTKQFDKDAAALMGDKYTAAVKKAYTRLLKNTVSLGGVDVAPDFTVTGSQFTVLLKPGTYVLDNEASEDGAPDNYKTLTVSGASVGAKPKTLGTVTSKEFGFKLTGLKAGRHAYALHNAGAQIHMYLIFRLDKGHSPGEINQALSTDGPPPAWLHSGGYAGVVTGGQTMYTALNFSSKYDYLLVCFMPDIKTGAPHVALGMLRLFHVK
jgi:hypothetical protein